MKESAVLSYEEFYKKSNGYKNNYYIAYLLKKTTHEDFLLYGLCNI